MFSLESWYPLWQRFNAFGLFCRDCGIVLWNDRNVWTTDRFVKQSPHTLYLPLEKLNDWSVHFAEKAEKAVRFLQRKLFAFSGNFLLVSLHDYLLLPQSELVSRLQNDVTKRRQTPQTSFRLTLIKNFVRLLEACGNFLASCGEDFWLLSFQSSCG